jgi:hypothetical protein
MCVSKGAPVKPAYGPCNENLPAGMEVVVKQVVQMMTLAFAMESVLTKIKEEKACV